MPMIRLIDLTKVYRGLRAVDGLNLEIDPGSRFGFLGPNGAGKTTTIKMLAGVLRPTQGRVIIDGLDLNQDPVAVKQRVGFIPDRPFIYEKLTGREFMELVSGLYHVDPGPSLDARLKELLGLFDMTHWQDELIESYSHGMRQRLIMCAALLHRPKVLVVDEPMVGLDPRGAKLVKDLFRQEAAQGTTLFLSTHSLEVAEEVCDRIAIIQAGKIIATGSGEGLREQAGVDGSLEQIFLKLTEGRRLAHERPLSAP